MKRILIVKMWALGDILVATPILTALKARFPDCKISWLVDKKYRGAVDGNPLIDEVISIDWTAWQRDFRYGNLWKYFAAGRLIRRDLQRRNFDIQISLTPDKWWGVWFNCAPIRIALFPSEKPGILGMFYTDVIIRFPGSTDHHIDRNLLVMNPLGGSGDYDRRIVFGVTDEDNQVAEQFLAQHFNRHSGSRYVVFHPGTSQRTKCWPASNFASLADLVSRSLNVVITGSPAEQGLAEEIKRIAVNRESIVIAAGQLANLGQTGALVKNAAAVVTGDTSLLHISSALNIPTIAIYGSTRPNEYAPLFGSNELLYDDTVSCAPCYKSTCSLPAEEDLLCLKRITPQIVSKSLFSILEQNPANVA
jgi:ADP-heptose:LPS heptosyltransferase